MRRFDSWRSAMAAGLVCALMASSITATAATSASAETDSTADVTHTSSVTGRPVTTIGDWNPDPRSLGGLPKDLLLVNEVAVVPDRAVEQMTPKEIDSARRAWDSQGPASTMYISEESSGRPGGHGQVRVTLPRQNNPGVRERNIRVTFGLPRGVSIASHTGAGWRCAQAACAYSPEVGPTQIASPLTLSLNVAPNVRTGPHPITGKATWQEQELRNGIGSWTGPLGSFSVVGWHRKGAETRANWTVDPPLGLVLAEGLQRRIPIQVGADPTARQTVLMARITNGRDNSVQLSWRQTGGPPAKLINQKIQTSDTALRGQTVEFPGNLRRPTQFRFAATARTQGVSISRSVVLVADPVREGTLAPNFRSYRKLGAVQRSQRSHGLVTKSTSIPGYRLHLLGKMVEGRVATAELAAAPGALATRWRVTQDGVELKPTATTATRIQFIPRAGGPVLVESETKSKARQTIERSTSGQVLLTTDSVAPEAVTPTGRAAVTTRQSAEATEFCRVFQRVARSQSTSLTLADGARLTLPIPGSRAQGTCSTTGKVTFTNATLTYGSVSLGSVAGSLSKAGFDLTSAGLNLPAPFAAMPGLQAVRQFTIRPTPSTTVGSTLVGSVWSPLKGTVRVEPFRVGGKQVNGIDFLPLPEGWSHTGMTFTFGAQTTPVLAFSQSAANDSGGSAIFSVGNVVGAKTLPLGVAVSGLGVDFRSGSIDISGQGTVTVANGGVAGAISLGTVCSGTCDFLSGLSLNSAAVRWSAAGLEFSTALEARVQGITLQMTGKGTYLSDNEFNLELALANDIDLGHGVSIDPVKGRLTVAPTGGDETVTTFSITGGVSGLALGTAFSGGKVTGQITNECPEKNDQCQANEVRIIFQVTGTVKLPGVTGFPVLLRAEWNVDKGTFGTRLEMNDLAVGPKELQITSAMFTFTNSPDDFAAAGSCRSGSESEVDAQSDGSNRLEIGFQATANVLGQSVAVSGIVQDNGGFCLVGQFGRFDRGGLVIRDAVVAYSTFDARLVIDGRDPVNLKANHVAMAGLFRLDDDVVDRLGAQFGGDMQIECVFSQDLDSFKAKIGYSFVDPVYLYGSAGSQHLAINQADLNISYIKNNVSMGFAVRGIFNVPQGADPVNNPGSRTPVYGSIGFTQKSRALDLMLGIDITRGPVYNGFGIKDLTIYKLSIAAQISKQPSFAFNGDVVLPDRWTSKLMFVNSPRTVIGFTASADGGCVTIQVGQPGQEARAFDLGGFGVVTGKHFKLVIAPTGCRLPIDQNRSQEIAPGFAVVFDGAVLGVPLYLALAVKMNGANEIESVEAEVKLPRLELGSAVALVGYTQGEGVKVHIKFGNAPTSEMKVDLDGAIAIGNSEDPGSSKIRVKGSFTEYASGTNLNVPYMPKAFDLKLQGQGDARLLGFDLPSFNITAHLQGWTVEHVPVVHSASIKGTFRATIKGLPFSQSGSVALTYQKGDLLQFYVTASRDFNFVIGSFGGTLIIAYCRGNASNLKSADGCQPGYRDNLGRCPSGTSDRFGIWLDGRIRFLFFSISTSIPVFNSTGPAVGCLNAMDVADEPELEVPATPEKPTVEPGNGRATITINEGEGGGPADSFNVTAYGTDGTSVGTCVVNATDPDLSCTISGLTNGRPYSFMSTAVNDAGESGAWNPSDYVVPGLPTPDNAPGRPLVEPGDHSIDVTAVAPKDSSKTAQSYQVKVFDQDGVEVPVTQSGQLGTCTVVNPATSMQCTVQGLQNGVVYSVSTIAQYGVSDTSPESARSFGVAPQEVTARPSAPHVHRRDGGIVVSVDADSAKADSYIATAFTEDPEEADEWTVEAGTCYIDQLTQDWEDCRINGLTNGTHYRASVVAVQAGRTSRASELSDEVIPNVPPGIPGVPNAKTADGSATVTIVPATTGIPTSYEVGVFGQSVEDPQVWDVPAGTCTVLANASPLQCTVTGLENATRYVARVRSLMGDTPSDWSDNSTTFQAGEAPGQPAPPTVVAGNLRLEATVQTPPTGGRVDYYVVKAYNPSGQIASSCRIGDPYEAPLRCVLANVPNDVLYTVKVTAINGAGEAESAGADLIVPSSPPAIPDAPVPAIGNGRVSLTMTPSTLGGMVRRFDVTTYDERGQLVPGAVCSASTARSPFTCTVSNLLNGRRYSFRAVAVNDVATSGISADSPVVIPGPPSAPSAPTVSLRPAQPGTAPWAQVTIRPGAGGSATHSVATAYLNGTPAGQCTVNGSSGVCNIYNLRAGQSYTFRAVAVNAAGTSPASAPAGPFRS